MANNTTFVWVYHILFFHSSVDGHLGFHLLAIVMSVSMNIHEQVV